eukprot:TRINITY_DN23881_c0_g1_i1.p1 TRINITY_DN23881_c0_g1~~TRINITY_DN23881_c0_g1_i1.p1  ORF type:complete len:389 (+),score=122.87 TRINITY_DN23881_c0_g1_i1:94-1167(+)
MGWEDRHIGACAAASCAAVALAAAAAAVLLSGGELLGAAALALAFGMRHGVGADHIAIIDGATRQLIAKDKSAAFCGLWFSAGHTLSVVLITSGAVLAADFMHSRAARLWGDELGYGISAALLIFVGASNIPLCRRLLQNWRKREYWEFADHDHNTERSWAERMLGDQFDHAWKLLPMGFLVGAFAVQSFSELVLVSITARAAGRKGGILAALFLPIAWAGGMGTADSIDGALMVWGYTAAADKQRLFFNLCLTASSAAVCFTLAAVEIGSAVVTLPWVPSSPLVEPFLWINDNFWVVGVSVIAIYAIVITTAVLYYRRYHTLSKGDEEVPLTTSVAAPDLTQRLLAAQYIDRSGVD